MNILTMPVPEIDCDLRSQMIEIWMEAFHDPEEYVEFALDHFPEGTLAVMAAEEENVLGCLYGIPAGWVRIPGPGVSPGGDGNVSSAVNADTPADGNADVPLVRDVIYGYAFAVKREHRGGGILGAMLRELISLCDSRNSILQLWGVPAMRDAFARAGLDRFCTIWRIVYDRNTTEKGPDGLPVPTDSVISLNYSDSFLKYAALENQFCANIWESVLFGDIQRRLIGRRAGDTLLIQDTEAPAGEIRDHLRMLMDRYRVDRIVLEVPEGSVSMTDVSDPFLSEIESAYGGQSRGESPAIHAPLTLA